MSRQQPKQGSEPSPIPLPSVISSSPACAPSDVLRQDGQAQEMEKEGEAMPSCHFFRPWPPSQLREVLQVGGVDSLSSRAWVMGRVTAPGKGWTWLDAFMPFFLLTSIFSGDSWAHQAEWQSERNPHKTYTQIQQECKQEEKDMRKSQVNNILLKRGFSSLPWKESYDKAR